MPDKERENNTAPRPKEIKQIVPVLDEKSAQKADSIINAALKANGGLSLVPPVYATDPDLITDPSFNFKKKLVLSEMLKLLADSLDPEQKKNVSIETLSKHQNSLKESINIGIGQMLKRLRPREELAHKLMLWKENGRHSNKPTLPDESNHTTVIIGPNKLHKPAFRKIIDKQLKSSNKHIASGEYRSFQQLTSGIFLPFSYISKDFANHPLTGREV